MTSPLSEPFSELLAIIDDRSWIWSFVSDTLTQAKQEFVRLPSDTSIRPSWARFKHAHRIIVLWENKIRSGGAIVEEILDIDPNFDISDRIIILSTNPTREDVVYINELSLTRIVKLRNRESDREAAAKDLIRHLSEHSARNAIESFWRRAQFMIDRGGVSSSTVKLDQLESQVNAFISKYPNEKRTAKYLDVLASICFFRKDYDKSREYWDFALSINPDFFRGLNNLVNFFISCRKYDDAFALMQKMHEHNRSNIMRMVRMGNVKRDLGDMGRAEHYYKLALERDAFCSGALNGMAEILFLRGDLEQSRETIAKSHLAEQLATRLNRMGIEMVKQGKYQESLDHYTKAQYVLPQQEKGPMLFYNIGLCYARWGKYSKASEFLRIALIKDPNYQKAQELLERVTQKQSLAG